MPKVMAENYFSILLAYAAGISATNTSVNLDRASTSALVGKAIKRDVACEVIYSTVMRHSLSSEREERRI